VTRDVPVGGAGQEIRLVLGDGFAGEEETVAPLPELLAWFVVAPGFLEKFSVGRGEGVLAGLDTAAGAGPVWFVRPAVKLEEYRAAGMQKNHPCGEADGITRLLSGHGRSP
jgi:hypothetical protein